jgi:hypothetical protein
MRILDEYGNIPIYYRMRVKKYVHQEYKPVYTQLYDTTDVLTAFLLSEKCPERNFDIVYDHKAAQAMIQDTTGQFILYNVEQLTIPTKLAEVLEVLQKADGRIAEVWDFSEKNCEILKENGFEARHVPIEIANFTSHWAKKAKSEVRVIHDVGLIGDVGERTMKIMTELKERGKKIRITIDEFMRAKDEELMKCKILVNVHESEDHKLFESVRCEQFLHVGMPIVSETSLDNDPRCINLDYSELVDRVCVELEKWDLAEKERLEKKKEEAEKKAAEESLSESS